MKYFIPTATVAAAVLAFILTLNILWPITVIFAVVWVTSFMFMLAGDGGDNSFVRQGAMFLVWGLLTVSGLLWLAYTALGPNSITGIWFGGVSVITAPLGLLIYGVNYWHVWLWSTEDDRRRAAAKARIAAEIAAQERK